MSIALKRDIPQSVRNKMPKEDFAGPHESFPIKTQADVNAAKHLVGHADDPEAVKAKIIAIAKRKGLTIPSSWVTKAETDSIHVLKFNANHDARGRFAEGKRKALDALHRENPVLGALDYHARHPKSKSLDALLSAAVAQK